MPFDIDLVNVVGVVMYVSLKCILQIFFLIRNMRMFLFFGVAGLTVLER